MGDSYSVLLPYFLAGGYLFLQRSHYYKVRWDAQAWERNIFEAGLVGALLFIAARSIAHFATKCPFCASVRVFSEDILPFPFAASFVAELALALFFAAIVNEHRPQQRAIQLAVERHGGSLLDLLHRAAPLGSPVMISMKDRKVYVGLVLRPPTPRDEYTRIIPTRSGFRLPGSLRVRFTTFYQPVYEDPPIRERVERFEVMLPISEIASARLFDNDTYQRYFSKREGDKSGPGGCDDRRGVQQ